MQLFYKEYPGPGEAIIVMHGLFGMLDNWHNVARQLSADFRVITVDLRNHGQSPHSEDMNYEVMAEDIGELLDTLGLQKANLLGHSMGGKVAMKFALTRPERTGSLVVVDMGPQTYPPGHNEIFMALLQLDISDGEKKRSSFDEELAGEIPEFSVRQFLLKSLSRSHEGQYYWKFNLPVLYKKYEQILSPITSEQPYVGPALFVRGAKSGYIKDADATTIRQLFPSATIKTVEGAGHWVHAEKPAELLVLLRNFLQ